MIAILLLSAGLAFGDESFKRKEVNPYQQIVRSELERFAAEVSPILREKVARARERIRSNPDLEQRASLEEFYQKNFAYACDGLAKEFEARLENRVRHAMRVWGDVAPSDSGEWFKHLPVLDLKLCSGIGRNGFLDDDDFLGMINVDLNIVSAHRQEGEDEVFLIQVEAKKGVLSGEISLGPWVVDPKSIVWMSAGAVRLKMRKNFAAGSPVLVDDPISKIVPILPPPEPEAPSPESYGPPSRLSTQCLR